MLAEQPIKAVYLLLIVSQGTAATAVTGWHTAAGQYTIVSKPGHVGFHDCDMQMPISVSEAPIAAVCGGYLVESKLQHVRM